ncbi:Histidine kinase [Phytophthora palmivora]|uniref:Histidine kinase n=1 Tax=Phytophthora palmivora TaxID=4796 RepID=A0A2P4YSU8_9STRA|nr:Histidine kinase [Phytophthora palmivora]
MTIATPAEVAISIDENDPKPTTETYTFKGVVDCNKKVVAELPLTLNTAWSSYWTEDYRVYPPAPPPTLCAKMKYYISLPVTAIIYLICHVREIAWTIVFCIPYVLFMPIMAAVKSCRFNRAAPVVTRDDFYYWLKRNGFSKDEMKKVKEAASTITMYKLAQKVTDVRAVEEIFKLQSIEKQKLVMVVIQQSREAIINANQLLFEIYRTRTLTN